jgi:hypothetical protein
MKKYTTDSYIKNKYCISKNIRLSRISYKDDILNKIEEIL